MADEKRPEESEGIEIPDIDEMEAGIPNLIESGVIKITGKIEEWNLEDVLRMFDNLICNGDFKSYLDEDVDFKEAKDLAWELYEMIYIASDVIYRNYLQKEWAEQLPS
tara:strand:+ start:3746 stop:4069 length:324 start_codon:yes stop_codon:yes gene_type:complete